MYKTK
jgi:hypothetical protein